MGKRGDPTPRGIIQKSSANSDAQGSGMGVTSIPVISELRKLAKAFIRERQARGLSPTTIDFYTEKLELFLRFCEARNAGAMARVNTKLLREYLLEIQETHSPGGTHALFRALRAFMKWYEEDMAEEGWRNPLNRVKAPKHPDDKLEPADFETIRGMLEVCNRETMLGARDYCWIMVLLDTGVRADELLQIDVEDVNLIEYTINIRKGKGRKQRYVYFGQKTAKAIKAYLRLHPTKKGALFVVEGPSGVRLQYAGLRSRKEDLATAAGVKAPKLHSFRRLYALTMLRRGTDIMTLGRLLGHTDRYVIGRYLNPDNEDARKAQQNGSPADHEL